MLEDPVFRKEARVSGLIDFEIKDFSGIIHVSISSKNLNSVFAIRGIQFW